MEWLITRLMARGRPSPAHQRGAMTTRGRVVIEDQARPGGAHVRVARIIGADTPPLSDVRLLPTQGDAWRITGMECVPDGPLGDETWYAQIWSMVPAPSVDLDRAERRVEQLLRELEALRAQGG